MSHSQTKALANVAGEIVEMDDGALVPVWTEGTPPAGTKLYTQPKGTDERATFYVPPGRQYGTRWFVEAPSGVFAFDSQAAAEDCQRDMGGSLYTTRLSQAPAPALAPELPQFIRAEVERAIEAAKNPRGMSLHDGRATIGHDKLTYLLALVDRQAAALAYRAPAAVAGTASCKMCDGDGLVVVGWDSDAYENKEGPCPECQPNRA